MPLTSIERKRLARLKRRLEFLKAKIANGGDLSYDHGEIASLEWVIDRIEDGGKPPERTSNGRRTVRGSGQGSRSGTGNQ